MTIGELGSIGELVGAIATVVTLVYLAIQIRSNTSAMRTAAAQSVHEAFSTWYRMLATDAILAQVTTNGLRDYASLSETNKARFVATFMAFLSCSQDAFIKWREGSLSAELWMGWELVMMNLVNCRVPDHHIVPSRSPLLLAREVFRELAGGGNVTDREVSAC